MRLNKSNLLFLVELLDSVLKHFYFSLQLVFLLWWIRLV